MDFLFSLPMLPFEADQREEHTQDIYTHTNIYTHIQLFLFMLGREKEVRLLVSIHPNQRPSVWLPCLTVLPAESQPHHWHPDFFWRLQWNSTFPAPLFFVLVPVFNPMPHSCCSPSPLEFKVELADHSSVHGWPSGVRSSCACERVALSVKVEVSSSVVLPCVHRLLTAEQAGERSWDWQAACHFCWPLKQHVYFVVCMGEYKIDLEWLHYV